MADRAQARLLIHPDATWLADYWEIELEEPSEEDQEGAEPAGEWIPATMRYGSDDWLVRFCLSQADRVRIVEPAALADEAMSRVHRGLEALD